MFTSRRSFVALAAATAASTLPRTTAASTWDRILAQAILINTLGGLENPNEPSPSNPGDATAAVNARAIADARASGITAINMTIGYVFGKGDPLKQSLDAISQWDELIRAHSADLTKILAAADIRRAKWQGKIGLIYGFQNAAMMGDDAALVDRFADLGMRVIQLTYNGPNEIGGGSMAPGNPALSAFGRSVIERLNTRRVIVDLAHSGQRTCIDATHASRQPVAISHTGCRALADLPRNKTDAELRLVAERGGYVGIYFMPFLAVNRNATSADVVAHIEHAVEVCGEDHVGVGTDGSFTTVDDLETYKAALAKENAERRAAGISAPGEGPDIYPFVVDLRGPNQYRELAVKLSARGHSDSRIEKLLGRNFLRYAREVWGS